MLFSCLSYALSDAFLSCLYLMPFSRFIGCLYRALSDAFLALF